MARICPLIFHLVLLLSCSIGILRSDASLILPVSSIQGSDGRVSHVTTLRIGTASSNTEAEFVMDTSAQVVSLSKCNKSSKVATFTFSSVTGDWFPGPTVDVSGINVVCNSKKNVAGLGSSDASLPSQVSKAAKLPFMFAYCLGVPSSRGQLSIGRATHYIYRNSDVLNSTSVPLVRMPLTIARSGAYQLKLTAIGMKSIFGGGEDIIQIGTTARYTSLPEASYNFLRQDFIREAARMKIKKESTGFAELDLCYKMPPSQLKSFSNVTMVFNNAKWVVSPSNYLVPKTNAKDVFCFAFVSAGKGSSSTIGTFQQEDNFIEYNLQNRTLGVSGSLVANLQSNCGSTTGS